MQVDLEQCLGGDGQAWDTFVGETSALIAAAVRRSLGPVTADGELDDVTQDVFLRLWKDDRRLLRTYDPDRASLSTWLTFVARSSAIDHVRRRARRAASALPETAGAVDAPSPPNEAADVPLERLSGRQRLVLRLLYGESMTVPQAAAVLGVDEQTIRSTKHKALARLREAVEARG